MSMYDGELDRDVLDLLRDIGEHLGRGDDVMVVGDDFTQRAERTARYLDRGWKLGVDLRMFLASHHAYQAKQEDDGR